MVIYFHHKLDHIYLYLEQLPRWIWPVYHLLPVINTHLTTTCCCLFAEVDDDDFNKGLILPPLIIQLKKILDQYPDDSQILKVCTHHMFVGSMLFSADLINLDMREEITL